MSASDEVNLDTSVLINYLYASLPGQLEEPRGSQTILGGDAITTIIGGKAEGEFEALCNRRHDLYADVVSFLLTSEKSIFEYDPRQRDLHTSDNDRTHFQKNIQMSWHDKDKREQLSLLRRINQDLEVHQHRILTDLIDDRYPRQENKQLLARLKQDLDIGQDRDIIVDAVEIANKGRAPVLLALDSDLVDEEHQELLAEILCDEFGDADLLQVRAADSYAESW